MPPARTTVASGRRPAAAATSAVSSPRRAALVGRRRVAGTDEDRADPRVEQERRHRPAGPSTRCCPMTVRQPLRDAVATSGASARSEAATTAIVRGGWLVTSRRGRSAALPRRRSSAAASPGRRRPPDRRGRPRPHRHRRRPASPAIRSGASGRRPVRSARRRWWRRPYRGRGRLGARSSPVHATRPGGWTGRERPSSGQASQAISSSVSSSRAMSSSIPVSSARISLAEASSPPNSAAQDRIEEQHRVRAERPVRPARLEEMDRRAGQAAELDLAGDLLDQLVALLLGRFVRAVHAGPPPIGSWVALSAAPNAS